MFNLILNFVGFSDLPFDFNENVNAFVSGINDSPEVFLMVLCKYPPNLEQKRIKVLIWVEKYRTLYYNAVVGTERRTDYNNNIYYIVFGVNTII